MTENPPLILPVENQVRELDGKLLLAAVAAERGFRVIIGSRFYMHFALPYLPRGVLIAKSLRNVSQRTLELTRGLGHEVVAWDEEGLVRFSSPEYYAWRYSARAFRTVDRLFTWGQDDADFFRSYDGYTGVPIHVTGNPRVDLLRPEVRDIYAEAAAGLCERYGDFILVNTNFSFANNFVTSLNLIHNDPHGNYSVSRTGRGLSREFAKGMGDHQAAIFSAFRSLVPHLSRRFPDRVIVIRPHPSENHDVWRSFVGDHSNVKVVHEGNVIPWLMACKVLLHNGCTTAVEAAVLDKPAVSYRPVTSAVYDYALPNSLSHETYSLEETCIRLEEIVRGERGLVSETLRRRLFARHLHLEDGGLAADRVVDVLKQCGYAERPIARPPQPGYAVSWIRMNWRTLRQRVNMMIPGSRHSRAHQVHRFPPISSEELNARIAAMGRHLGRFAQVRATPLGRHLYELNAFDHE